MRGLRARAWVWLGVFACVAVGDKDAIVTSQCADELKAHCDDTYTNAQSSISAAQLLCLYAHTDGTGARVCVCVCGAPSPPRVSVRVLRVRVRRFECVVCECAG